jgi:hypothetical protein
MEIQAQQLKEHKPSRLREKGTLLGLWWRDIGIKGTLAAVVASFFTPAALPWVAGGVVGYVGDEVISDKIDKNRAIERRRARAMGIDDISTWGQIKGALRWESLYPFGPRRMQAFGAQ